MIEVCGRYARKSAKTKSATQFKRNYYLHCITYWDGCSCKQIFLVKEPVRTLIPYSFDIFYNNRIKLGYSSHFLQ